MLPLLVAVLLASPRPSPADMEAQALGHVQREFERAGRTVPQSDAALSRAAQRLAMEAVRGAGVGSPGLLEVTGAMSAGGAADPSPRTWVTRGWTRAHTLEELLAVRGLAGEPATHVGVGMAEEGERSALVVLLVERKARLLAFTRSLAAPGGQTLCGVLEPPLGGASVFVTRPDGHVEHPELTREKGASFCSRLLFPAPGRYTVEVVATGPRGPEVASLLFVDVGAVGARDSLVHQAEPARVGEARQALLARINALRRAHALRPLRTDSGLERVAQAYSERMAREGFFAHVSPDGEGLRQRLDAAGIRASLIAENIAQASGPLAAHFGLEHSPGHRSHLLSAQLTRVGIGVVLVQAAGQPRAVVTQVFAGEATAPQNPFLPR
jgi:uncharacterized protein YkwD